MRGGSGLHWCRSCICILCSGSEVSTTHPAHLDSATTLSSNCRQLMRCNADIITTYKYFSTNLKENKSEIHEPSLSSQNYILSNDPGYREPRFRNLPISYQVISEHKCVEVILVVGIQIFKWRFDVAPN